MQHDSEYVSIKEGLDYNGDGLISAAELRHIMCNLGEKLEETEVDQIVRVNVNTDGKIKIDDFLNIYFKPNPITFNFNQILLLRKEIAKTYIGAYDGKYPIIIKNTPEFVSGNKTIKIFNILAYEIYIQSNKFDKIWKYIRDIATEKIPLCIPLERLPYDALNAFDHFFQYICNNRLMLKYLMKTPTLYEPWLLFIIKLLQHEFLPVSPFGYTTLFSWFMETLTFFKMTHISFLLKHHDQLDQTMSTLFMACVNAEKNGDECERWLFAMLKVFSYVIFKGASSIQWNKFVLSVDESSNKQVIKLKHELIIKTDRSRLYTNYIREVSGIYYYDTELVLKTFCGGCASSNKFCGYIGCKRYTKKKKEKRLKICAGCRLVYYCCRKHQKKDWKFVHSQQCLQYI
eukprot:290723_1